MGAHWNEGTKNDLLRIRIHHENPDYNGSIDKADEVEDYIYAEGNALGPNSGAPYKIQHIKARRYRTKKGYLIFFRLCGGSEIEIFAVFHERSGWKELLNEKIDALE
jgi:plasmid stabilization system protein ParE